jgi:hypothetical protein
MAVSILQELILPPDDWQPERVLAEMPAPIQEHCKWLLARIEQQATLSDEKLLKEIGDALLRLRERNLGQHIRQLEYLILECADSGAVEESRRYHEIMVSCLAQRGHLERLIRARTLTGSLDGKRAASAAGTNGITDGT